MELEQTTLFKGITSYECFRMRSCFEMREESFLAGETVMRYGDGKSEIGIVLEGSVFATRYTIDGERMFIEYIEAGDLFGESLAFAGMEDDISIVCHENAKVIFIDKKHIVKRCENACRFHTDFVQNFIEALSERTVKLSERVEILSNRSTREKLLCYFNLLAAAKRKKEFEIPFSVSGLADFLCVNRSAMTRELKKLVDEGVIKQDRRFVSIN